MKGLRPIADEAARVLILGTFPGGCSLVSRQYYADPRNQFWELMARAIDPQFREGLHGESPASLYQRRVQLLRDWKIALWDVLAECRREGSSDRSIRARTARLNNLKHFLSRHRTINRILFNGTEASRLFWRHFRDDPDMSRLVPEDPKLPSSSSQARGSVSEKARRWRRLLGDC